MYGLSKYYDTVSYVWLFSTKQLYPSCRFCSSQFTSLHAALAFAVSATSDYLVLKAALSVAITRMFVYTEVFMYIVFVPRLLPCFAFHNWSSFFEISPINCEIINKSSLHSVIRIILVSV